MIDANRNGRTIENAIGFVAAARTGRIAKVGLIAKGLYAGTSDAIGMYEGEEAIIDFKTSKKIKKEEWIEDYYLQCCAYAMAHNEMYDTNIKKGVILMVSRDNKFKEFVIEGARFEMYCDLWETRLTDYYASL